MIGLLVALTLSWTMPSHDVDRGCAPGLLACEDTLRWELWWQPRKSPWVPGPLWPLQIAQRLSQGTAPKGRPVALVMPSPGQGVFYVVTLDRWGNFSCDSNYVLSW